MQHELNNWSVTFAQAMPVYTTQARYQQAKRVTSCACLEGVQLFHEVLNAEPGHLTLQLLRQVLKHLKR